MLHDALPAFKRNADMVRPEGVRLLLAEAFWEANCVIFSVPPCKGCGKRSLGCHSGCAEWDAWKDAENRKNSDLRASLKADRDYKARQAANSEKFRKRMKVW